MLKIDLQALCSWCFTCRGFRFNVSFMLDVKGMPNWARRCAMAFCSRFDSLKTVAQRVALCFSILLATALNRVTLASCSVKPSTILLGQVSAVLPSRIPTESHTGIHETILILNQTTFHNLNSDKSAQAKKNILHLGDGPLCFPLALSASLKLFQDFAPQLFACFLLCQLLLVS